LVRGSKTRTNLERKRCVDGHEYDDFDTTTASMLMLFLWLKRLWCKNYTFQNWFS